jgi:hypothetical protein
MLRRGAELARSVVISPELVLMLLGLGGFKLFPPLESMVGSFVIGLEATQRFWLPGVFVAVFVFSLNKATGILKPNDELTNEALKSWPEFFILEKRIKATLIWTGSAAVAVCYLILAGMSWQAGIVGRWLLTSSIISLFAAYSIWNAEIALHRLVNTSTD